MEAKVVSHDSWRSWSLNQFSKEFGVARETVVKRINDSGILSGMEKGGFPVYRVGEVATAILKPEGAYSSADEIKTPADRRLWWASEKDKLAVEKEAGLLISVEDSREQMADIAKMGLQILETLPDILERDFNLDPEIVESVENKIHELRESWADKLEAD